MLGCHCSEASQSREGEAINLGDEMKSRAKATACVTVLLGALLTLSGCSTLPYEKGAIWCNEPLIYDPPDRRHFDKRHLDVARHGYIYALAGAHVLQGESDEDKHHFFGLPDRLKREGPTQDDPSTGFSVATYKLYKHKDDAKPEQIIIAFKGSDDRVDWIFANLLFDRRQYDQARAFTAMIYKEFPDTPIIVTGYSLGGALAGHVTKHQDTKALIAQAWLFNPSPKLYTNNKYDKRIWVGALRGEVLGPVRSKVMQALWPGINRIGAPSNQDAQDYYLISSFTVGGHYRWVLARNILFVADYAHLQNPIGPVDPARLNEPLDIIKLSNFKACEREMAWRKEVEARKGKAASFAISSEVESQDQRALEIDNEQDSAEPEAKDDIAAVGTAL